MMRDHLTEDLLHHVQERTAFHIQSALDALDTDTQVHAFLLAHAAGVIGNTLHVLTNESAPFPLLKKLSYEQQVSVMVACLGTILGSENASMDLSSPQALSDMLAATRELRSSFEFKVVRK